MGLNIEIPSIVVPVETAYMVQSKLNIGVLCRLAEEKREEKRRERNKKD